MFFTFAILSQIQTTNALDFFMFFPEKFENETKTVKLNLFHLCLHNFSGTWSYFMDPYDHIWLCPDISDPIGS